jgi:predicted dithiol-disulfide oxidoreductase (DUF899 family)
MNPIVSHEEWLRARTELLQREKELTRLRDELSAARRALPWERVAKSYVFQGPAGDVTLPDLFAGRRQLLVYHFMFGPDWERGCKSCSFWADGFNGTPAHLARRDVSFAAISRAPLEKLQAFARRLGWTFPWLSSGTCDFNFDYAVSFDERDVAEQRLAYNFGTSRAFQTEMPGLSCFYRADDGTVLHTYSTYARGIDVLNPAYQLLDLAPRGRDEQGLSFPMEWVRLHDEYGA